MVAATAARGRRLGAGPRTVLRDLRSVEDGDPELFRCASDECGGGGDQQQGAGDHQADVRAEVGQGPVDASDPGPESGIGGDRLVDRADPPDGPRSEGPFRPVLHLKTEEPFSVAQGSAFGSATGPNASLSVAQGSAFGSARPFYPVSDARAMPCRATEASHAHASVAPSVARPIR